MRPVLVVNVMRLLIRSSWWVNEYILIIARGEYDDSACTTAPFSNTGL